MVAAMTPESASAFLAQLEPALDDCRHMLAEAQRTRSWSKEAAGGRQETVTDLDLAVEERIITAIHAIDQDASVYSEETRHDPSVLSDEACVVLDPIDGTDLLVAGQTGFSISVAILSRHRVIAGLLDFPAREQRLSGRFGGGAQLNGRRIRVNGPRELASARVSVSSTQRAMPSLEPVWHSLGVAELVPTPGFTAKLASILLGESAAALYLPVKPRATYIWDYAAAALLLEEAGGTLTTLDGERFLDKLPLEQNAGWLASTNTIRESIQRAVATALKRLP
jgi:myo-inositol-1(or 4)-monophosphatase